MGKKVDGVEVMGHDIESVEVNPNSGVCIEIEDPDSRGNAVHYSADEEGFAIWRVGPNGRDDGGRWERGPGRADDHAVRFPPKYWDGL